ncbi:MAG TPA: tail fiber protein [Gemmataceae bacterium]|nr:tail fiber protein [Gemmataceae bacterium]
MAEPFLAEIKLFAGNFAPRNYALCNGQILPISQNTALFSLIGTYYGGNGTSNFALPNLQGRAPIHQGQGPGLSQYVIGENGGEETVTLQTTQMPSHSHTPGCDGAAGTQSSPTNSVWAATAGGRGRPTVYAAAAGSTMNSAAVRPAGGGQPHNNMSPYLVVNFIIALQGVYPSRN